MSRTGLSPSYLGCGRLTTEGYGSARRERVHGLHQFLRACPSVVTIASRWVADRGLQSCPSRSGDDPKIAVLKTDAQKAIDAGDLVKADALLADVEMEQGRSLDRFAVNAAETSARRGEIALTRLRYAEAAMLPPCGDASSSRCSAARRPLAGRSCNDHNLDRPRSPYCRGAGSNLEIFSKAIASNSAA